MIEVYDYLNSQSHDIINDIFKLRELRNFHIFQTDNPRSSKNRLDAILYCATQLWQQVLIDIREAASLALFKNCIKTWKHEGSPCKSSKIFIQNVGYI